MNDDYTFYQDRRRFMKGTGTMLALGSLPAYLTANANDLKVTLGELQQHQGIVVYREDDAHSVAFADTMAKAGLKTVALSDDLVRQWRDGLGEAVSNSGTPLLGLTSWPDYLLLSGLAFEARKYPLLELQHAVEQPGKANWSASLALDYMHLPVRSDKQTVQEMAQQHLSSQAIAPKTPSLFSWLIG